MRDDQVDALVAAADDGVDFDGLRVTAGAHGYTLSTPTATWDGLSTTELADAAAEVEPYVTNWYYWTQDVGAPESHRYAFLRWVEGADETPVDDRYDALSDGVHREWGELALSVELGEDGTRRYGLRHVDDVGADLDALDHYEDPLDARGLATYDDRGRYRPLKTAPSLVGGWAYADLDGGDVVSAVDTLYPATIANWHLEREDELDVTHWDETAERQTGIYGIVDELDADAVEWIAESCCVDSQCLKRREWDHSEGDELDADRGDGEFPCREPCSLVVAAARKWTTLEREETHTYEFDLTPSEKEQLEALVDAVADGRVDEIREADVYKGANRYRARYLRAKRFDDHGNLSGTPTHHDDE